MLTFKKFLCIINEDATVDKMVMDIQTAINNIDNQINIRTQPLLLQKNQLQKRLGPLLKKKQADDANAMKQQGQPEQQGNLNNTQQTSMKAGSTTTTPGSNGAATPGSIASANPIR